MNLKHSRSYGDWHGGVQIEITMSSVEYATCAVAIPKEHIQKLLTFEQQVFMPMSERLMIMSELLKAASGRALALETEQKAMGEQRKAGAVSDDHLGSATGPQNGPDE